MHTMKFSILIWFLMLAIQPFSFSYAEEMKVRDTPAKDRVSILFGVEYLFPTEEDRDINTVNLDAFYLIKEFEKIKSSIYTGLTATYATGDITQLEGTLEEGTLREVKYDNTAFGIGPGIMVDFRIWHNNRIAFHINGSGGLIIYNKDFPAGGKRHNFMWRTGPMISYMIGDDQGVGLGYQWMHVSNGQGVGPQNPAYDAQGPVLQFNVFF